MSQVAEVIIKHRHYPRSQQNHLEHYYYYLKLRFGTLDFRYFTFLNSGPANLLSAIPWMMDRTQESVL